jgi:DNA ligase (NAD+)
VYRINSYEKFESMGYTAHHPKGAFALKTQKQGEITTLVDVEWQVGKSGVVSPVAILDPVDIEGATVSRATLHNINYIRSLDLKLGCQVEVIRSGDIIPRIVRRVDL